MNFEATEQVAPYLALGRHGAVGFAGQLVAGADPRFMGTLRAARVK